MTTRPAPQAPFIGFAAALLLTGCFADMPEMSAADTAVDEAPAACSASAESCVWHDGETDDFYSVGTPISHPVDNGMSRRPALAEVGVVNLHENRETVMLVNGLSFEVRRWKGDEEQAACTGRFSDAGRAHLRALLDDPELADFTVRDVEPPGEEADDLRSLVLERGVDTIWFEYGNDKVPEELEGLDTMAVEILDAVALGENGPHHLLDNPEECAAK